MEATTTETTGVSALPIRFLRDWISWWGELPTWRKWAPAVFVAIYWPALLAIHGFRPDHLNFGLIILILGYGGRFLQTLMRFLLPLILTGIIYDSMRFYSDYLRGPVHVTEPYDFDKRFFGITTAQGVLTPNEWWQLHTHPALDLVTGLAYLIFIFVFVLTAAYFVFWLARKGTTKVSARDLAVRAPAAMWAFFWVNMIGYSTYYWYAAAPPWYVASYGLGPADMTARANPAGCLRFDQLLGTHFFTGMYGRSADVFGAIPSLHVSYPLIAAYFAFRFGSGRVFTTCFYLLMCFSAVYLNHHYVLDILWGSSYALLCAICCDAWFSRKVPSLAG